MRFISPDDSRLTWRGAVSLEASGGGVAPWRLPVDRLRLYPPAELRERAAMPAGVRIALETDTSRLGCLFEAIPDGAPSHLDLCLDDRLRQSLPLAGRDRVVFDDLPVGEKRIELWLPHDHAFRLRGLELDDGASLAQAESQRHRWVTYGSSITQCLEAHSPARTWPALVARHAGLDLTCLGYAGQCHLEPMLARLIRDLPADLISLCLGINVHGGSSLSPRTFRPAVIGFASIVRERHPGTPLALISPIYSPERETQPNAVGLTLEVIRDEVRDAVSALRECGDADIHYVDGLELLSAEEAHLLPDLLHPSQEGYELMAQRFRERVLPLLVPAAAA